MAEPTTLPRIPNEPVSAVVDLRTARQEVSFWTRARISLLRARWPVLAILILLFVAFLAMFGPQIAPKDPNRITLIARLKAPFERNAQGQMEYILGTDTLGRDVLSRLIYGARVSLSVGLVAVCIGGTLGTLLGLLAGYFGGWVDDVIMRLADIELGFPFILLAIMVMVVLGSGVLNLILVLGIGQWVTYARIARGETMSQREKEYIEAAHSIGASNLRVMFRGILPNILSPLIVIASFNVASVILAEASLSFLGLGVPPTVPTWGAMLAESRDQLLANRWWLAVFPGVAIMLTVLSLNILGDWLRDFLDPRLRGAM
jgi:peptide/nickel transport system permease protein